MGRRETLREVVEVRGYFRASRLVIAGGRNSWLTPGVASADKLAGKGFPAREGIPAVLGIKARAEAEASVAG